VKIVFIADFFTDQVLGGGELNNEELIGLLVQDGHRVKKVNSAIATRGFIEDNMDNYFIIGNFINLSKECIASLYDKQYVIYEHDHKYINNRNPSVFKDFLAPKEALVNVEFYKKANAVLCQTQFHLDIVKKNLNLNNLISLGGNLWSEDSLDFMAAYAEAPKAETCAVMDSPIEHKNTREAVMYCRHKKLPYKLIKSENYKEFLKLMSEHKTFVFFPKTPETLSRVVVEARMMGMGVIVNKMIGATREPWYNLKGQELISLMRNKKSDIKDIVVGALQ
tara:strand:- start:1287 stop:2123 length:837 start_codon:yes stop_codon:yes gene_type:complete